VTGDGVYRLYPVVSIIMLFLVQEMTG